MKYILKLFDETGSEIAHSLVRCRSELPVENEELRFEGDIKGTYEVKERFRHMKTSGICGWVGIKEDVPVVQAYKIKE